MIQQFTRTIKANLTPYQIKVFDHWRECYLLAWNAVLNEIDFTEKYRTFKEGKEYYCSPIPWQYKPYYFDEKGAYTLDKSLARKEQETVEIPDPFCPGYIWKGIGFAPFTPLINHSSSNRLMKESVRYKIPLASAEEKNQWGWLGGYGYSCPINYSYWLKEGEIGFVKPVFGSLLNDKNISGKFRAKHIDKFRLETQEVLKKILSNTKEGLPHINQKVLDSYMIKLNLSYANFIKGDGGKPRFKGARDVPFSISNSNPDGCIKVENEKIFGFASRVFGENKNNNTISCPGISKIWKNHDGTIPKVTVMKIVKKHNGYEVQLTGQIVSSMKTVKETNKLIGFDPGLLHFLTDDQGRTIGNPEFYEQSQKRLASLQQELDNKKTVNLFNWLHDKQRQLEELTVFNISKENAILLQSIQTEQDGIELIGSALWQKLKHNIPINLYGKRIIELQHAITKLHDKIAKQRKHFLEDKTTMIIRNNQNIAIETGLQGNKNKAVPLPVKGEDGQYKSNNKKFISQRTKRLADTGLGYFLLRLKQKADYHGRRLEAVNAVDTTNVCPCCEYNNEYSDEEKSERILTCKNCGYTEDQDKKAAILIAIRGFKLDEVDVSQFTLSDDIVQILAKRKTLLSE